MYDATTDELTARFVCGRYSAQLRGLVIRLGHRVTGWVASQRSTIVNSDAALDLGSLTMQLDPPPRSCLSTALCDGDRLVGALTIYSTTAEPFIDLQSSLVEALAPRIASALRSSVSSENSVHRQPLRSN
jgi:GAF domain-containing protein